MAPKVLVTDDAVFMRMVLRDILSKNGFEVIAEAQNGVEAIEKYKEHKPDLVLMDITMPEMNGIDALKGIRQHDPNALVIMCTASGQQNWVQDALVAGAKDYVVKPFNPTKVVEILRQYFQI
ncbi:MAG: response regulator [Armatimonadetes bacterium]|nr:response regulator [Armatimonadota bacterium]